jgi:uncharacterized protein (DUF433 family)
MATPRRIVNDPRIREGAPTLEGTHVAVGDLLHDILRGVPVASLCDLYPLLSKDDIKCALEFGARRLGRRAELSPRLSVIVVVFDMPEQARRTLLSLSPRYQQGVTETDYEVVVVENESPNMLGEDAARACCANVRYLARQERFRTPVFAANAGVRMARADVVALCIDGARLVTPGIIGATLDAMRLGDNVVVAVPGYHLGSELQQRAVQSGYDAAEEAALLESIDWPTQGYRLFDVACASGSCRRGPLEPMAEANFLAMQTALLAELGGYDIRFDDFGGGYCNLDLYSRMLDRPDLRPLVLLGEGTFHQYHDGATTGGVRGSDREVLMANARAQYEFIRGKRWRMPERAAEVFGHVPPGSRRFFGAGSREPTTERRLLAVPSASDSLKAG